MISFLVSLREGGVSSVFADFNVFTLGIIEK